MTYYGVTRSDEYLAHYGIKGMKWGVRKFTDDSSGKANKKFESLYGKKATKKISPRAMQKHFNSLDQSYANINQRMRGDTESFLSKSAYHLAMKNSNSPYYDVKKEEAKYVKSAKKDLDNFMLRKQQLKNVEEMQMAIMQKAKDNGYTVKSTPIIRSGVVGIPTKVRGQKVKISKNGDGKSDFIMYKKGTNGETRTLSEIEKIKKKKTNNGTIKLDYSKATKYKNGQVFVPIANL